MTQLGSRVCIAAVEDDCRISYSITSLASASRVGGISRSSALAVLTFKIQTDLRSAPRFRDFQRQ